MPIYKYMFSLTEQALDLSSTKPNIVILLSLMRGKNNSMLPKFNDVLKAYSLLSLVAIVVLVMIMTGLASKITNKVNGAPTYKQIASIGSSNNGLLFSDFVVTPNGYADIISGNLYIFNNSSKLIKTINAPQNTDGFKLVTVGGSDLLAVSTNPSFESNGSIGAYNPAVYSYSFSGNSLWQSTLPANLDVTHMSDNAIAGNFTGSITVNGNNYVSFGGSDVAIISYQVTDSDISFNSYNTVTQIGGTGNDTVQSFGNDNTNYLLLSLSGSAKVVSWSNGKSNAGLSTLSNSAGTYVCDYEPNGNAQGTPYPIGWLREAPNAIWATYITPNSPQMPGGLFVLSNNTGNSVYTGNNGSITDTTSNYNTELTVSQYSEFDGSLIGLKLIPSISETQSTLDNNLVVETYNNIFVVAAGNSGTQIIKLDNNLNVVSSTQIAQTIPAGVYQYNNNAYLAAYKDSTNSSTPVVIYQLSK